MSFKKIKPYLITGGVSLAAALVLNSAAKRFQPAAKLRDLIGNGI